MLMRLIDFLKTRQITALFTSLTQGRRESSRQTDVGISSLIDTWILVRDVELNGERNRCIYVLKSRGMAHSNQVREFVMSRKGIRIAPGVYRRRHRADRFRAPDAGGPGKGGVGAREQTAQEKGRRSRTPPQGCRGANRGVTSRTAAERSRIVTLGVAKRFMRERLASKIQWICRRCEGEGIQARRSGQRDKS